MRHSLRIGLDAHMVGGHETGNETYVLGLIDGIAQLDEDIELFVYGGAIADHGRTRVTRRHLLSGSPITRLTFDLPLRALKSRLDVLHCTYTSPLWAPCPVVLTVHDISFEFHPEWFSARDLRVLKRTVPWSAARAGAVVTVSEFCRREIIERYRLPPEKVFSVHNAAGPAATPLDRAVAHAEVSRLGIDPSRPFILAVGNLQPRKNLVRLIAAFSNLRAEGVDADLVLVGPEHYRAALVHEAAASVGGHIRFTGYLSDRQLAACYATAKVFCFPSLFEGFGIPALEAMAHGIPVVCSNAGALPEICGDAAVYFDPTDDVAIGSAVKRVLAEPDLQRKLGEAGRVRQTRFSWVNSARETLSVYRGAIQRAGIQKTSN